MYIGDSEYKGQAPGPFVGLDLNNDLYIGAVPDFRRIARAAGYSNGFTGQFLWYTYLFNYLCVKNCMFLVVVTFICISAFRGVVR